MPSRPVPGGVRRGDPLERVGCGAGVAAEVVGVSARVHDLESRAELRGRINLALSLLSHRGHTAETAVLVERVLRGESIEQLAAVERRTTKGA